MELTDLLLKYTPKFAAWFTEAREQVAAEFARLTPEQRENLGVFTVEDFALDIYAELQCLTPTESAVE